MIVWFKFIHIAAIAIWAAGLICLPGLYVQRAHVTDKDQLYRLQRMVRFAYVGLISPAAFVAIASGTGLIFLQAVFTPWFSAKLGLVATLVVIHALTGLVIIRLFRDGEVYPAWRFVSVTILTLAIVTGILFLVLVKPVLNLPFPAVLGEPGALQRLIGDLNPWPRP